MDKLTLKVEMSVSYILSGLLQEEASQMVEANGDIIMPSIPDEFLQKLDLTAAGKRWVFVFSS